jgi:proteic killer suppression protein
MIAAVIRSALVDEAFSAGLRFRAEDMKERLSRLELRATKKRQLAPSNHLEPLGGDRKGQHSIRINKQWRICFEWPKSADGPENVEIIDYH